MTKKYKMIKEDLKPQVFQDLRKVMESCLGDLKVKHDTNENYYILAKPSKKYPEGEFFGAVQLKKGHVGYYLMPIYCYPELKEPMSEKLGRLLKGKSCFNVKKPDDEAYEELRQLTERCYERYVEEGLI